MSINKSAVLLFAAALAISFSAVGLEQAAEGSKAASQGFVVDTVVATVGTDVITQYDVKKRMQITSTPLASIMAGGTGMEDESAQFKQALDDLISDMLVLKEARKSGITVPREEVDAHVDQLKKRNNWTDSDFAVAVGMLGFEGVDAYRAHASNELLKSKVLRMKIGGRISVSDREVQEIFDARYEGGKTEEEIHLAHIAIPIPDDVTDDGIKDLLRQASEIRKIAARGDKPFDELARTFGRDSTAARGGDVGWFPVGRPQPSLEEAAFGPRDGEISDVVQSSFGFHILTVLERRRVPLRDADEARRRIKWELSEVAFQKGYKDFVMELRRSARINVMSAVARPAATDGKASPDRQ